MSFLNLGKRLQPARKAWKTFTSKLQTKLHKLHKSKAIKKPTRNQLQKANTGFHPSFLQSRHKQRKKYVIKPSQTLHARCHRCYLPHKRTARVYIDELFKQPVSELVPAPTAAAEVACKRIVAKSATSAKKIKKVDRPAAVLGASKEGGEKGTEKACMADDMWESVGLASPLMHGIDERAEEFIARFRAEMELQEMVARSL